jgi:hypothetical protein
MSGALLDRCLGLLRRDDVRTEIKKALSPLIGVALEQLYPYIQICLLLVLVSFLLQAGIFLLLLRGRRLGPGPQTFSSAIV